MRTRQGQPETVKSPVMTETSPEKKVEISESSSNPLTEAQAEIQNTFSAHLEARKDFEESFRNVARRDEVAYRSAQKKFQVYQFNVTEAFTQREINEQAALEAYRRTVKKANETYRQAMQRALDDCQRTTEEARKGLVTISNLEPATSPKSRVGIGRRLDHAMRKTYQTVRVAVGRGFQGTKNLFRTTS